MTDTMMAFVEHIHTCETCKKNEPGTRPFAMKLCAEGIVLRGTAFSQAEKTVILRLALHFALASVGIFLIGTKLGSEVAVGAGLLYIASKIKVKA